METDPPPPFCTPMTVDTPSTMNITANTNNIVSTLKPPAGRARAYSDTTQPAPLPQLSPAPLILESPRLSKDDSHLKDPPPASLVMPVTPVRTTFMTSKPSALNLDHLARSRDTGSPSGSGSSVSSGVLSGKAGLAVSPKLDHRTLYSSPTNIIPRRSRGMDYSRAATSLHHSTLAPDHAIDSSPTANSMRAQRRSGDYAGAEHSSTSLLAAMERSNSGTGLKKMPPDCDSDSSSDDNMMDEDTEEPYVTTPNIQRTAVSSASPWPGAPSTSNPLMSYRDKRTRQPKRRGRPLVKGMAFANLSRSPPAPSGMLTRARRESVGWAGERTALAVGSDAGEEGIWTIGDGSDRSVIRKVAAKRMNMLPKTKGFARIRAALAEETAPVDSDFRREAEVVRQVMDCDRPAPPKSTSTTAQSSPNLMAQDLLDVIPDDMMMEAATALSDAFKTGTKRTFQPAQAPKKVTSFVGPDGSFSTPLMRPTGGPGTAVDNLMLDGSGPRPNELSVLTSTPMADVNIRIGQKRRRDDDLDPLQFKRRAVSPSLSAHGSPVMQSPRQRDNMLWVNKEGSQQQQQRPESGSLARKGRVGLQGMVDTNDGIMRMSID